MLGVPDVKSLNPQIRAFLLNLYILQVFYLISQTWTPHACTLSTLNDDLKALMNVYVEV